MREAKTYNELLQSEEWKTRRTSILSRDNHQCLGCGSQENLQVHHRQYHLNEVGEFVMPWDYAGRYLITLCDKCHELGHSLFTISTRKRIYK